jgi:hypothetical protein
VVKLGTRCGQWAVAVILLWGCSASGWKPTQRYGRWTLYHHGDEAIDPEPYREAFDPAFRVVETALGPFEKHVQVYASSSSGKLDDSGENHIRELSDDPVQQIPGIGAARVRAFHARDSGLFSSPSGIFLNAPEAGTAAHELVHARFAEEGLDLPLWLEEGIACFIGDGILAGDRWVVDGLACWPLYELGKQPISDAELEHLLRLHAKDDVDARDNVLVHFVGWAIVFDLYRENGQLDTEAWKARYSRKLALTEARARLERTVDPNTALAWLERLDDARPEVRLAAAKGVWKLRSPAVVSRLLDALGKEDDPTVKVGLSINVLAAAGETRLPRSMSRRMWSLAWPAIKRAELDDPTEQAAATELTRSLWSGGRSSQVPLQALKRFWAE